MCMKKLAWILLLVALLGCSRANYNPESEETTTEEEETTTEITTVCTNDSKSTTFYSRGDEIYRMEDSTYQDLSESIDEDIDKDAVMESINQTLTEKYGSIEGVSFSTEWEDNNVHTILTIDYDVADMQALVDAGILEEGNIESQYISLEKTLLSYQSNGYACGATE